MFSHPLFPNPFFCGPQVTTVDIDSQTPATIYIGTGDDGLFRSTDGGTTWSRAGASVAESFGVSALAVDPEKPTTLYAGTSGRGVFKSSDGGESWHESNTGLTNLDVRKLVIDPRMPATLYVATGDSISKSSDGGATWRAIHHYGVSTLALDPRASPRFMRGLQVAPLLQVASLRVPMAATAGTPLTPASPWARFELLPSIRRCQRLSTQGPPAGACSSSGNKACAYLPVGAILPGGGLRERP